MATIKREIGDRTTKVTLTTTLDPANNDVYDVVMYTTGNRIDSGWYIAKNGNPISRSEMIWDDRFVLHTVLKREFAVYFADAKSNFKVHLDALIA